MVQLIKNNYTNNNYNFELQQSNQHEKPSTNMEIDASSKDSKDGITKGNTTFFFYF